jgi:hypothetical protein
MVYLYNMLNTSGVEEVPISGCNLQDHGDTAVVFGVTATFVHRVLVEKLEGKRPLGRPRRRWEDNIKMDIQEMECGGMDCIDLAEDRDKWRVLLNRAITFGFHKIRGIS